MLKLFVFLFLHQCCFAQQKRSSNGTFTFPNQAGLQLQEGWTINITWITEYKSINLYLWQNHEGATWRTIARGVENSKWAWLIEPQYQNLTFPFSFYAEDVYETGQQQFDGGFGSETFYILPGEISVTYDASQTTNHPSTTQHTLPSFPQFSMSSQTQFLSATHSPGYTGTIVTTPRFASITATPPTLATLTGSSGLSSDTKLALGLGISFGCLILLGLGIGIYYLSKILKLKRRESELMSRVSHHSELSDKKSVRQQRSSYYESAEVEAISRAQELDAQEEPSHVATDVA